MRGTWKQALLAEVGSQLDLSRVHFVGQVPHNIFVALMQVSRVHAYLTYPFVLSWSLLEAMAAGAPVIASRTPPVE
ncbi:MAG: glycosyltransferase, partial [Rhodobacter sp.]|nr:glycosyltransferase [Rhodobacter sp.]